MSKIYWTTRTSGDYLGKPCESDFMVARPDFLDCTFLEGKLDEEGLPIWVVRPSDYKNCVSGPYDTSKD